MRLASRRKIIKSAVSLLPVIGFLSRMPSACFAQPADAAPSGSLLRKRAAAKGILFGSEVLYQELQDPVYAALIKRECAILVPGHEAKWPLIEPQEGKFAFAQLDWIVDFAVRHGLVIRLHNLVWSVFNPSWLEPALAEGRGEAILQRHIKEVVGRYRGLVDSWDVLNEPSDPRWHTGPEGLTLDIWRRSLGPQYPAEAFGWAHEADPLARLFVNDAGMEYDTPESEAKRATYLRLVDSWLKTGVPIEGFGIEAHIQPDRPFTAKPYRRFLAELAAMGLTIYLTELDVSDRTLPADIPSRDRIVADHCRRFLDVSLDEPAVKAVLTWGLTDRTSWLNEDPQSRRADGLQSRGLPFDDDLQPTPMYEAIGLAFDHAPAR